MRSSALFVAALAAIAIVSTGPPAFAGKVTRYAVLAGNNQGLARSEPLKYAQRDARRMSRLLQEIGSVPEENMILLEGEDPAELRRALDDIAGQASKRDGDKVFLFYYSGHADSGMLRMGGRGISLAELRRRLEEMPVKVKVAIVDACQSGEITRSKGGVVVSPFMEDRPVNVEGLVILTSASAAEPAQESEVLRSSFFSHHLMSGLRGPADVTGDGRVSAVEAYEYAYRYTVRETEGSESGPQHPTFLYALEGEGDIALTAFRSGSARMVLPEAMDGTVLVVGETGSIETEVVKRKSDVVDVALAPGRYEVRWRSSEALWVADVDLDRNEVKRLGVGDFERRSIARGMEKGAPEEGSGEEPDGDGEEPPEVEGPRPLSDVPLGGGAAWNPDSMDAAGESAPSRDRSEGAPSKAAGVHIGGDTGPVGPVYDSSRSFARRSGARLSPGASLALSLVVPGMGHGADRQYSRAGAITGVFLGGLLGSAALFSSMSPGDTDAMHGVKTAGGGALALTAFYAYAYAAIDAFYSTSRGGPGVPDLDELRIDLSSTIAPVLMRTPEGVKGGIGGGFGIGAAPHPNFVLGLRNVNFIAGEWSGVTTVSFAPEVRGRGMFTDDLGWSVSLGLLFQVHLEGSVSGDDGEVGEGGTMLGLLPYLSGGLHYFPARSWSLDFGVRGGVAIGTRRFYGGAAQADRSVSVEYIGGLSWYI